MNHNHNHFPSLAFPYLDEFFMFSFRIIVDLALQKCGEVVSNDKFRDIYDERLAWQPIIRNR